MTQKTTPQPKSDAPGRLGPPGHQGILQRKCACGQHTVAGGECAECRKKRLGLQRRPAGPAQPATAPPVVHEVLGSPGRPLDPAAREFLEPRFGHDFSGVRVHTDARAAESARAVNALAYTVGQDIVFGAGAYSPGTDTGRRLLAHELTHTIQQGVGAGRIAPSGFEVGRADDPLEWEAGRVADRVMGEEGGASDSDAGLAPGPALNISDGGVNHVQRFELPSPGEIASAALELGEEALETGEAALEATGEALETVGETIAETGEAIADIAGELWDYARAMAQALDAAVTISGTSLIIAAPPLEVCPILPFQFSLPEIGQDFEFLKGEWPIAELVLIYGSLGLHVGLTPEISAQLGPCQLHGLRIVIDPLAPSFSASGGITLTTALGLGGELRAGLRGDVGVTVIIPAEIPIPIEIPVVGLEAGLAGFGRGILASTLSISGSLSYTGGRFSLSTTRDQDLGLGLDLGLAGYGQIDLLGQTLCRLYWPLWEWHRDVAVATSLGFDLALDTSGPSLDVNMDDPQIEEIPFDDIPLAVEREMFTDECMLIDVLCDAGYALGLMPSQRGATWDARPKPRWGGPLFVYKRDPAFASGSLCRGACGPDCDYCSEPRDVVACEQAGEGGRVTWVYPNYVDCGTHSGCREHDACYDWCAERDEKSLWGPCHRLCDLECACNHPAHQCVGWIFGQEPHDGRLPFSDEPYTLAPSYQLIASQSFSTPLFTPQHFEQTIWSHPIPLAEFGWADVSAIARGDASGDLFGGYGPGILDGICLSRNLDDSRVAGYAHFRLPANLGAVIHLLGALRLEGDYLSVIPVVAIEGAIDAVGRADASAELNSDLEVIYDLASRTWSFTSSHRLSAAASLGFSLDIMVAVEFLAQTLWSERWNLIDQAIGMTWEGGIIVRPDLTIEYQPGHVEIAAGAGPMAPMTTGAGAGSGGGGSGPGQATAPVAAAIGAGGSGSGSNGDGSDDGSSDFPIGAILEAVLDEARAAIFERAEPVVRLPRWIPHRSNPPGRIDERLLQITRDARVRGTDLSYESFRRNYAVFKVERSGEIEYVSEFNEPGELHSEQVILRQLQSDPRWGSTRILQVYSEREPCPMCLEQLNFVKRVRRQDFTIFFTIPQSVPREERAQRLMEQYLGRSSP